MPDDLFGEGNDLPHVDPNKNYLEDFVGDGKKFKTVEDLARAKAESDAFIARLQRENAGMREDLNQRARLGDIVDRLVSKNTPNNDDVDNQDTDSDKGNNSLDPNKLNELVEGLLSKREQENERKRNIEEAKKALSSKFGSSYSDVLKAKADELGISQEDMTNIAAKSPNALLRLVGAVEAKPREPDLFTPPQGANGGNFQPNTGSRNKAFYDQIKKTDAARYWSPAVQNQMHQDAINLGPKFFE